MCVVICYHSNEEIGSTLFCDTLNNTKHNRDCVVMHPSKQNDCKTLVNECDKNVEKIVNSHLLGKPM